MGQPIGCQLSSWFIFMFLGLGGRGVLCDNDTVIVRWIKGSRRVPAAHRAIARLQEETQSNLEDLVLVSRRGRGAVAVVVFEVDGIPAVEEQVIA